ncbi:MAG: type II secretion system F family protein, partial [Saccharofermentanales bacterium]
LWMILPSGLLVMHDVDLQIRISSGQNRLFRDFPGFIGLLSTLLSNGIVLTKSVQICIDTFTIASPEFRKELSVLKGAIYSGTPVSEALENLAIRSGSTTISGALLLAAQYGKNGSTETLGMLSLQAGACWLQSRTAARKQIDESSVKLLLPMMLQLICVMLVSVLPSLLSIGLS